MARRADITVGQGGNQYTGGGTCYLVQTLAGVLYAIYADTGSDVSYRKSTDGGLTWSTQTVISGAITATAVAVWYDRWSDYAAGLIHVAFQDSAADDTFYRTIDTENSDTLSNAVTTIMTGSSTAAGGHLSIVRAKGGNVYCKTVIDAGAEGGFYRLPSANVPNGAWDAARTVDEAIATTDQMILLPDLDAADTNDIMAIFWDASADEISRKLYDDSANSWSESSIATSMVDQTAASNFPHFAAAMDIANTRAVLVAWSAIDTLNADLRCWTVDSGSISEVTNVVQNSTDDQGLAGISIDPATGEWTVVYGGKSDGSETFSSAIKIYCKGSRDSGSTWGPETALTSAAGSIKSIFCQPRRYGPLAVYYYRDLTFDEMTVNVDRTLPRAGYVGGIV